MHGVIVAGHGKRGTWFADSVEQKPPGLVDVGVVSVLPATDAAVMREDDFGAPWLAELRIEPGASRGVAHRPWLIAAGSSVKKYKPPPVHIVCVLIARAAFLR